MKCKGTISFQWYLSLLRATTISKWCIGHLHRPNRPWKPKIYRARERKTVIKTQFPRGKRLRRRRPKPLLRFRKLTVSFPYFFLSLFFENNLGKCQPKNQNPQRNVLTNISSQLFTFLLNKRKSARILNFLKPDRTEEW